MLLKAGIGQQGKTSYKISGKREIKRERSREVDHFSFSQPKANKIFFLNEVFLPKIMTGLDIIGI